MKLSILKGKNKGRAVVRLRLDPQTQLVGPLQASFSAQELAFLGSLRSSGPDAPAHTASARSLAQSGHSNGLRAHV